MASLVAVLVASNSQPTDRWSCAILFVGYLSLATSATLGVALARGLPTMGAVVVSGVLVYVWFALLTATDWATLRYLSGSFATCCTIDQRPATGMVVGSATFFLIGGALLVLSWSARQKVVGSVIAAVVLAVAAGTFAVRQIESEPGLLAVSARDSDTQCVTRDAGRICVWPEHHYLVPDALPVLIEAVRSLREAGIESVQADFSESLKDRRAASIQLARDAKPADLIVTLVQGLLPNPADCRQIAGTDFNPYAAGDQALVWLVTAAGMTRTDVMVRFDPVVVSVVDGVRNSPVRDQQQWINDLMARLRDACSPGRG